MRSNLLAEEYERSKATEQQAMMSTQGEKSGVSLQKNRALSAAEMTHAERHVPTLSTLGYEDTPKWTTWEAGGSAQLRNSCPEIKM